MSDYLPKWHQELQIFDKITPIIIFEGNVLDKYQFPDNGAIVILSEYLNMLFHEDGYEIVSFYDSVHGFYNNYNPNDVNAFVELIDAKVNDDDRRIHKDYEIVSFYDSVHNPNDVNAFVDLIDAKVNDGRIHGYFNKKHQEKPIVAEIIGRAIRQNKTPTAIIMDFASRYIIAPSDIEQEEVNQFAVLTKESLRVPDVYTQDKEQLKNLLILIVNRVSDLPTWFYLDNPNVKTITINKPSKIERELMIKGKNFSAFFDKKIYAEEYPYYQQHPDELNKIQEKFIGSTDGFSFTELNGLRNLSKHQKLHIANICDAIDLFKFGIKENPWNSIDRKSFASAEDDFRKRIKGQDTAIVKTLDIVKRAILGMTGIQANSNSRPKGVLFFAGPTGTGKTEMAKTLAEKLFGTEKSVIRFDMSEYREPQSDQKLLGAPPGYVGYEAGGQLTNAVKNNPFSILLFDEIEKAHPSILDKFLQILEDGRMTDGQGNTVYFSETIIIFTSNLGIYGFDSYGNRVQKVSSSMSYSEVQEQVRSGIENYFKLDLGRPEILNRIGENIVVFNFIREDVAEDILDVQIDRVISYIKSEMNIEIKLDKSSHAYKTIKELALNNLENGGRGIGNIVEICLINPLARYIFDNDINENEAIQIEAIDISNSPYTISCKPSDRSNK